MWHEEEIMMNKFFLSKSDLVYRYWLVTCMIFIAIIVVLGGYTRLTDSGLSITEWNLITGILPPLNNSEWELLFFKYRQIPQFELVSFTMDLEGFKEIFWLEYIHRLVARILGVIIIIPALFFFFCFHKHKLFLIKVMLLVILQGCLGWFMVTSGLKDNVTVSHFRLAIHLILAFILFAIFTNHLFMMFYKQKLFNKPNQNKLFIFLIRGIFILISVQVIYGAFVAGLDAGMIYNDFPLMGNSIYPPELFLVSISEMLLYNAATVQFIHRVLAYIICIFSVILLLHVSVSNYHKIARIMIFFLIFLIFIQAILGIITILTIVNANFAVMHQFCGLILFATIFTLCKRVKR